MQRIVVLLVSLATLSLSACAPSQPADAPTSSPRVALLAAARLPRDTALWIATRDLSALCQHLDKRTIERGLRARYEALTYELVRETGHNLLDLGELEAIGVDVQAAAGVAWLPAPERALVGFVTLRDSARFKAELYRAASGAATRSRPVRPEVVGDLVIAAEGELAVLVDDRFAMLVVADDAWTVASRLAKLDARETLERHAPFRAALEATKPRAELVGYADVRALIYEQLGIDPRWRGTHLRAAQQDIERAHREALLIARERHADPNELVVIDERFRQERAALRDDEAAERLRKLAGAIDGAALSLDVESKALTFDIDLHLDESSLLRRALKPRKDPKLPAAAPIAFSAAVDPATLAEIFGTRALTALLDVDVVRDIVPALDGELSAALWPRTRSGVVRIGVRERGALERVLSRGIFKELFERKANGEWLLRARERTTIVARVRDGDLELSSGAVSKMRWTAFEPGTMAAASIAPGDLWLAAIAPRFEWQPMPPVESEGSAEYRQKRQQLAALDERIARQRRAKLASAEELARGFGRMRFSLAQSRRGLDLEVRYATRGVSLAKLIVDALRFGDEDEATTALLEERRVLDDELYELEAPRAPRGQSH